MQLKHILAKFRGLGLFLKIAFRLAARGVSQAHVYFRNL